tara:strand:- start:1079 stop:1936 length:858 start_codon:yes stop_codon:yes gene_type:complete
MTYLQLINSVLVRLREEQITAEQFEGAANPYWAFIGSAVNDAKDRVEDAWQWGALRGTDSVILDDTNANNIVVDQGVITQFNYYEGNTIALPNSIDSHYIIHGVYSFPLFSQFPFRTQDKTKPISNMSWITAGDMDNYYQTPTPAITGRPSSFAITGETSGARPFVPTGGNFSLEGSIELTFWPPAPANTGSDAVWGIGINRTSHQAPLVNATDRILVPSLPVFTLATALASRERGEVGGAPTSELFMTADKHLSDAIAQDSTLYANELNWYANDQNYNTNVRFA